MAQPADVFTDLPQRAPKPNFANIRHAGNVLMKDHKRFYKSATLGLLWAASLAAAYYAGGGHRASLASDSRRHLSTELEEGGDANATHEALQKSGSNLSTRASQDSKQDASAAAESQQPFDPQAEFDAIMTRPPGPLRNQAMEDLFERWAEVDGPTAMEKTASVSEPLLRYELKESVLRHWAKANPEAAFQFALTNPNNDLPAERIQLVLQGMTNGDVQTALDFFQKHSNGELRPYLEGAIYAFDRLYQKGGHDAMVPWAEALPAGKMKDGAINRIVDQWARYDPAKAKVWMEKMLIGNAENTVPARVELAESWARVNPQQALNWVNGLPGGERKNEYFEVIYKRWLQYDQNAAAAYLANQPPSPTLDPPIERYTYQVMGQNPSATMPWAESISDPNRRWRAIERVASVWRRKDPTGLANYVSAGNYTPDQRRTLLKLEDKK